MVGDDRDGSSRALAVATPVGVAQGFELARELVVRALEPAGQSFGAELHAALPSTASAGRKSPAGSSASTAIIAGRSAHPGRARRPHGEPGLGVSGRSRGRKVARPDAP